MKKLKFSVDGLKDKSGNAAQIGDLIKVRLPEFKDFGEFYLAQVDIIAQLHATASQGLMLIVKQVLTPNEELKDSDFKLVPGQIIKFKHVKWDWWSFYCLNCYSVSLEHIDDSDYCKLCPSCGAVFCPCCNKVLEGDNSIYWHKESCVMF
jgi:hypothetical protein